MHTDFWVASREKRRARAGAVHAQRGAAHARGRVHLQPQQNRRRVGLRRHSLGREPARRHRVGRLRVDAAQHSEAEAKRRADKKVQERDAEIRRLSEEKQKLEAEHSAKMTKMSKRLGKEEGATRRERERAASEATRARQDSWVATKRGDEREAAKARYDKTPQLSLAVLRASCLPLIPRLSCAQ